MSEETYLLAAIAAGTTAAANEWLHSSSITEDIPELGVIGDASAEVASVSIGLAVVAFAGVVILGAVMEEEI